MPDYCGSGCDQLDRFSNRDDGAVEAAASNDNWGLSFQEEGKTPVGNATPEFLKQYNAYFCGNSEDKKILFDLRLRIRKRVHAGNPGCAGKA
mgnify:CR=1 FL=1